MNPRKILILAPHPDDETLGAGGTLLKHRDAGAEITWVIGTAMGNSFPEQARKAREAEIEEVAKAYGFKRTIRLGFAATEVDTAPMSRRVGLLSEAFKESGADTVYLPYRGDVHSDHRALFEAAMTAVKTFRYPMIKRVLSYETPSETDFALEAFQPNVFVDISAHFNAKAAIMGLYRSELAQHPFPRSLEGLKALATVRGAQANVPLAESFALLKEIS